VQAAVRTLKGEKVPPEILLPVFIIDKDNVAKVARTPEERGVPSWDKTIKS
jgi:ABC-type sugar transport system substrate-binding protein